MNERYAGRRCDLIIAMSGSKSRRSFNDSSSLSKSKSGDCLWLVEPTARAQAAEADQSSPVPDPSDRLVSFLFSQPVIPQAGSEPDLAQIL